MYGHLVVGAAFLGSPQETYITYLVVRAGWENAQIATYFTFFFSVPTSRTELDPRRTMLYHLIALHPHRDITLHVSANNPAMVRHCLPSFIFRKRSYRRWSVVVQPVRIQGGRVHRRVLRSLSRYASEDVHECVSATSPSMSVRVLTLHRSGTEIGCARYACGDRRVGRGALGMTAPQMFAGSLPPRVCLFSD